VATQERIAPFRPLQTYVDRGQSEIATVLKGVNAPTPMQWNSMIRAIHWNDPPLLCLILSEGLDL